MSVILFSNVCSVCLSKFLVLLNVFVVNSSVLCSRSCLLGQILAVLNFLKFEAACAAISRSLSSTLGIIELLSKLSKTRRALWRGHFIDSGLGTPTSANKESESHIPISCRGKYSVND